MAPDARRFLFATFDGGGNVAPMMSAAQRLVERGHRVRVISDAVSRDEAEGAGAAFITWRRAPNRTERTRDNATKDFLFPETDGIKVLVEHFVCGQALARAQDVVEALEAEPADLVVAWDAMLGAVTGCEAIGQKVALLTTSPSIVPLPGRPPVGSGLTMPESDGERAVAERETARLWETGLDTFNAARAAFGLAPLERIYDQAEAAEMLFIGTSAAFDFGPDRLPAFARHVGPLIRDPVWARPWTSPWPAGDTRPLLLVGFSTTFQNHAGCLQRVIDAAAGLPVRVLVTRGQEIGAGELRPAANTVILEGAPHDVVMREARLVVTHGGHGTVMAALTHGLPMLVIPHGRDQADNAVRVVASGAGLSLPSMSSRDDMREALERLLEEEAFTAAARRLGSSVAAEVAGSTLIADLEALASATPRRWPVRSAFSLHRYMTE